MQNIDKCCVKRCVALLLAFFLIVPSVPVSAASAAEPRASDYLEVYSAYVSCIGDGVIKIWFDVTGTGYLDEIGALGIQLYESTDGVNWTWVATYEPEDYPNMIGHNELFYCSHVEYTQAVSGRYYRAFVYIIGNKNGGGDSRCFYTSAKLAP